MQSRKYPKVIESGGVVLTLTPDEVYVEFSKEFSSDEVNAFIREYGLEPVKEDSGPLPTPSFHEVFPDRHWLHLLQEKDVEQYIDRLQDDDRIRIASPVYHREDLLPKKIGLSFSNYVLVRLRGKVDDSQEIKKLFKDIGEDVSGPLELPGGELHRLRIKDSIQKNAFEVADEISKKSQLVIESRPDWMQLNSAISTVPNDTFFGMQWNMHNIVNNPSGTTLDDGWTLSTGDANVVIAILDTGCDLNHEDLRDTYVPVGDRRDVVAGTNTPADDFGHGTCCAGIAAATSNNGRGVAGVTWNCRIMPIRMMQNSRLLNEAWIVDAVNWARTHRANVISMSFDWDGGRTNADLALDAAAAANIVLVAASGNDNVATIDYPARHPNVIAIGATDRLDQRHRPPYGLWVGPGSPDGECWGSNYDTGLSVMAPGVNILTTDMSLAGRGYNWQQDAIGNYGQPYDMMRLSDGSVCGHYASCGDAAGNYFSLFSGTSAATPHVAGLAALLQSLYPLLRWDSGRVRNIIEQTAVKAGGYSYSYVGLPNGTWNREMGYGLINVFRALDFADVYIKDSPLDNGSVPFKAGYFWDNSDIVVRNSDDDKFEHQSAIKGRDNYIYVRVNNLGPATARNVKVSVRAVRFPGTEFVSEDWTRIDSTHIKPVSMISDFDSINAAWLLTHPTATAKFKLESSQVDELYGWEHDKGWHPCLLAEVKSENDYASTGIHTRENNNLAQRNISIVPLTLSPAGSGIPFHTSFPFATGNKLNMDSYMEIVIDRSTLPKQAEVLLNPSDTDEYFPALEKPETDQFHPTALIKFLDRTRLLLSRSNFKGIMTLEAGSTFEDAGNHEDNITIISQQQAEWVTHTGKRLISIRGDNVTIGVQKQPGELRQMSLSIKIPDDVKPKDHYQINVSQRNTQGQVVGGVSLVIEA